jgi:aspartyl-tRNA(Asn)/glutamyl-tRNA(Gln) amidotransferase subunit C
MTKTNEQSILDISKKSARLARIAVSDEEHAKIAPQLEKILGMFEQLQAVDTDGIEPLANVVGEKLKLRVDEITDGGYAERVLANAPDAVQGFYGVPKVVE